VTDTTIGSILVSSGLISEEQREEAAVRQVQAKEPLTFGEVLVSMDVCSKNAVERALELQNVVRNGTTRDRAHAMHEIATNSKLAISRAQQHVLRVCGDIIERAGFGDVPTPVLGVPLFFKSE
jgi:hypothetical protein